MTKPRIVLLLSATLLSTLALLFYVRYQRQHAFVPYNPAYNAYLSAYTEGIISKKSNILVRFSGDRAPEAIINQPLSESPFSFSPSIEGHAQWIDSRTLVFMPKTPLESGQYYQAELDLAGIVNGIPEDLSDFRFQFKAKPQSLQIEMREAVSVGAPGEQWQRIEGEVSTADFENPEGLERIFKAIMGDKELAIRWQHFLQEKKHVFTIDSVMRGNNDSHITLVWNGENGIKDGEKKLIEVPAKGAFKHTAVRRVQKPSQHIAISFSDPIAPGQNLEGLVHLGVHASHLSVEGNTIKVYPKNRLSGEIDVFVEPGIENIIGKKTAIREISKVTFDPVVPEVKLVGSGTILPNSGKLPLIFEAVGLNAIDVRVIKIFEDNIPQFLQVNTLSEAGELRRVGQEIFRQRMDLTGTGVDLMVNNIHSLELSKIIEKDPGAIYEVAIGFKKEYALCDCSQDGVDPGKPSDMLELSNWDSPSYDDYSYWDGYYEGRYDDRDNPCRHAFYHSDRIVRRNVLASDFGLIAKQNAKGDLQFITTDLNNAQPFAGVELEVYDFQQRMLTKVTTDGNGISNVPALNKRPFLLIAKRGKMRGYLRLDDGQSLSMSRFDIQGQDYVQGVKGFIYAERGVWRPGDRIYATFIMEDKLQSIPQGHPITFELFDPQSKLVKRLTRTEGVENFYPFFVSTDPDAPTGNYLAKVTVGGSTFYKSIKVETIMPNRLKINIGFGKEALTAADKALKGQMEVKWLHGAIAQNLKATVDLTLTAAEVSFPKYAEFNFNDPVRSFATEDKRIFEGSLDAMGLASIPASIKAQSAAPGMLNANFKTKVEEPGGNFSSDAFTIPYYPYNTFLGVRLPKGDASRGMLLTDTDHSVEIASLDPQGNPVSKANLDVKVYKLDWKWWWDQSAEELADYKGKIHKTPIQSGKVATTNGAGSYKLRINYPDWGRYLVRVCDGSEHCTGKIVYIDWPGWAGRAQNDNPGGATMLVFSSEKEQYTVGEQITLNIPTGMAGKVLVSLETGSKILQTQWLNAEKGNTRYTFTATNEMAPNIYASVMLLQPHSQTVNDLPIRMYGVIPIKVEAPQTKLQPTIAMNNELGPMEEVNIRVAEASARPMTYTLAVVDEGLLDLTRFKTPSPWHTFYQREALKIKTWDLFNEVLGAYGGQVKSLLGVGGDAELLRADNTKQDRFKPVVVFLGPFTLGKGETKTHTFQMPNYVGSVKVMVVAADKQGAYGNSEKVVPVRKPLMALATLPRVLGPGEAFKLPVSIFAMDPSIQEVKVTVEGSDMISVGGIKTKAIRFTQIGDQLVTFDMKARSALGKGSVKITAQSGSNTATYNVDVEVRTPNPRVVNVFAAAIEGNKAWEQSYTPLGMAGTNTGMLEVSSIPPMNMHKHLAYLIQYPYGCLEQTTSSVFPQLHLTTFMDLPQKKKDEAANNVKAGIERLRHFQLSEGGFGYWPGQGEVNQWASSYAGHFLLEAEIAGYNVPSNMIANWKNYSAQEARKWVGDADADEKMQAYRLYLLALAKAPEMGAMNRLRMQQNLNNIAKWYLASAYSLAGQAEVANQLAGTASLEVAEYTELGGTYGSALRDQAIILQALSIMGQKDKANNILQQLSTKMASENWYSTQTLAYGFIALAKYVGKVGGGPAASFSYRINGGNWEKVKSERPLWQFQLPSVGGDKVEFKNEGGNTIYARIILEGVPERGDQTAAANGLSLDVKYTDINGAPINVGELKQGTDFKVEVTVKNTGTRGTYEELALNHIFPSGWEIHNTRMSGGGQLGDRPEYQDIRDDRVYSFFDLKQGESKTFVILLHASYEGSFYMPTIAVEAMYDHGINARKPGEWVKVLGN